MRSPPQNCYQFVTYESQSRVNDDEEHGPRVHELPIARTAAPEQAAPLSARHEEEPVDDLYNSFARAAACPVDRRDLARLAARGGAERARPGQPTRRPGSRPQHR